MLVDTFALADNSAAKMTSHWFHKRGKHMNNIIYIVGLVVIVLFILGALGLR